MKRLIATPSLFAVATLLGIQSYTANAASLKIEHPGKVIDCQGVAALRPTNQERWTPLKTGMLLSRGDWVRTEARGANAVQIRLAKQDQIILGPGGLIELTDENNATLTQGEAEVSPTKDSKLIVHLPGNAARTFTSPAILRATEAAYTVLPNEPDWLKYLKGNLTHESMGALVAKVDGRDLPLTLGYHKVTVDIRDQIARTVIEESFVNHTATQLEGVFFFPLPQDASISGFAMWIGNELVEADVVEKERAREIYETILREKRDPGLLEWSGGNIFKARVFPIFPHSEKRIRITYTQVLPCNGNQYRYSYALQSDMLKQTPLRELELRVNVFSEEAIDKVTCLSHNARVNRTKNAATVEFAAQEYTPTQDFEVEVDVKQGDEPIVLIPHRRGDDGYFLLLVNPPEKQRKTRPLLADGPPLDLIVVADTSASMDCQQRQLQDQFIGFLLGSLGKTDRFRVAAADADVVWFNPTTNAAPDAGFAPSEENIEKVRTFLANRVSLGWTDLGRTMEKVLKHAGKNTHVVYVGDGIDTSKDCNPGSIAKGLKLIHSAYGGRGAVHAVAVSSSYEPMVMKALASLGAGSFRRLEGTAPARDGAMDLLEELTAPGIRNMKVEFKGMRVARVYPGELPNLPAGRQQIVLGRYLPQGRDNKGTVVVSGEYKGKTVRYEAAAPLKDAESGNAFIPRLWARMHLESLLEQGQTPEVKNDVIALSEEYAIMTPYTSFLVLESDTDRERFSVKRRFKMRDGEKFFAEGRDAANFQLVQKSMQLAGAWRQDLRRQILRDLMTMGRVFPVPHRYGGMYDLEASGCEYRPSGVSICGGIPRMIRSPMPSSRQGSNRSGYQCAEFDERIVTHEPWAANERLLDKSNALGFDDTSVSDYFDSDQDEPVAADGENSELDFDLKDRTGKMRQNLAYRQRRDYGGLESALAGKSFFGRATVDQPMFGAYVQVPNNVSCCSVGYATPDYRHVWLNTLFPDLTPIPLTTTAPPGTNWSEQARALSRRLLRQDKLSTMAGGLEIKTTRTAFDAFRKVTVATTVSETLYSPASWVRTTRSDGGQTIVNWYDGKERGVFAPCYQLGRRRAAEKSDADLREHGCNDFSYYPMGTDFGGVSGEVRTNGAGTTLLVLRYPRNSTYGLRFLVDTNRNVVLTFETWNIGKLQSRTTFADFVSVAGSWWATKVSSEDGEGRLVSSTTIGVRQMDEREFAASVKERLAAAKVKSILIAEPLPALSAALQAESDKERGLREMTFEQILTLISTHIQRQEHDKTLADWVAARSLVTDRPGAEWLETEILLQVRRNEEARQKIRKSAATLAAKPVQDELHIAKTLHNQINTIGQQNEVLALLDDLKPLYERQAPCLFAMKSFSRMYAETLRNVGRTEEALVIWRRLVDEFPVDTGIQTRYIQVLVQLGEQDAAFAHVRQLLAKQDLFSPEEREQIRSSIGYSLANGVPPDKWLAFIEAWLAEGTANSSASQFYLSALFTMDKIDDMRRVTTAWVEEGIAACLSAASADPSDNRRPLAMARMQAAVSMALGNGYGVYTDYVDPYWYPLLSRTVKELFANDAGMNIAGQIMQYYRLCRTDEAHKLRQHFVTVLSKDVAALEPQVINQVLAWISVDAPKVDMEVWKDLAERLEERWAKETDADLRNQLSGAVVTALNKCDPDVALLNFLRRRYREGGGESAVVNAAPLFDHLLKHEWSEASESEAFAILPRLSAATNSVQRIAELVPRLYALTDRLLEARVVAGSASSEARSKMTRQELAAEQVKLHTAAKEGLVVRFRKELPNQEDSLRPWLTVERLRLETQLNKDAKSIAGECWKLLPQAPSIATNMDDTSIHLLDRAMTTLSCLAARRTADSQLVARVHAYIDAGIAASTGKSVNETGDDASAEYWRYQKYRLLVARDEAKTLGDVLAKWITPSNADPTWRCAMAYMLAEQGRISEAIACFESLDKSGLLDQTDLTALAGWYMATDQRDKQEAALIKSLAGIPDYQLSNMLHEYLGAWQQNSDKAPTELDPEVTRIFAALFDKAQNPSDYFCRLREFYQRSRDPRLLQCMVEGMFGHTVQQTYSFIRNMREVLNEIRDESATDALIQKIGPLRTKAKTTVDNRALDFLEMQVYRRATEVKNQPGPHIAKALAAMQRVSKGDWAIGERRLMADTLGSLGKISSEELVREQLRQLRELHQCRTEPAQDRLAIAAQLARALWTCEKRDEAVDVMESALTEYRQTMGGTLPATANDATESYIGYLEARHRFLLGQSWLQTELARPANQQQQYWLTRRILALYVNALRAKAEVSLGRGEALCHATYSTMLPEFNRSDRNHRSAVLSIACNLFETAKHAGIAAPDAREFALSVCPAVIAKESDPYTYRNQVTQVGRMLKTVLGSLTSLEFLVERIEKEPRWLYLNRNYAAWQAYAYDMGQCRMEAGPLDALEARLLGVVTTELRRDLTERRENNRCMYSRHNSYFWQEKAADFKAVAEAIWSEQKTSGAAVHHIASYLWHGLDEFDRAIEMLAEAHANQILDESGQSSLASFLHYRNRFAQSIPVHAGLIAQRPDALNYRTQLMTAYFKVGDQTNLKKTLIESDKYFHAGERWQENNIAGLAYACVSTSLYEESVKYYNELIPLRKRTLGGRTTGDSCLSEYYRQLANAYIGLGRTIEAVDAASGSIVVWGQDRNNRYNAMCMLQEVLRRSPDLAGYVTHLEKQVAETNLENPIVRKALGRVFLEKKDIKEAIRHLSIAMEVQPNDRETCDAIVSAYDRAKDASGAIRRILATLDLSRRDIGLYADLGNRYLAHGDSVQSERAYLSIAEMLPNESESHAMLAGIRQRQNRWEEAIHHWRQVIRIRSLEPMGFQRLAQALIHQKQWKEATENIDILSRRDWPQRFGDVHTVAEQLRRQIPESR